MFLKNFLGINRKADLNISIVGGSNSVMRRGYAKYLDSYISQITSRSTELKYYSLGGVPNIYAVIQQARYDIALNSDIIFFEYCVNDRHAIEVEQYSLELAGKSLEGFIRKVYKSNPQCIIVILIFGINLEHFYNSPCILSELYESIGEYYSLPVIDITELLSKEKGLSFVKSLYSEKDHAHYTRPDGAQVVSQTIVEELKRTKIIKYLKAKKRNFKLAIESKITPPDNDEACLGQHYMRRTESPLFEPFIDAVQRSLETADIPIGNGEFAEQTVGRVPRLEGTAEPFRGSARCSERWSIYTDNLENLAFFENFEEGNYFLEPPKTSIYRNTVYREKNSTIYQGNALKFLLKGKLLALYIKSDLNDGFITIEFDSQRIVTSSYSSWVNIIKPQNVLNLITLPLRQFSQSKDFAPVSISLCQEYPQEFVLDFNKTVPTKPDPHKWKLSIIGVAYIGKFKEIE